MAVLGTIDLEIIRLGISKKGTFNENDIAESDLKRLGVGKMLDSLASLNDRKMLRLNQDGSFSVTDKARCTLWDDDIPEHIRTLRLLEIRPAKMEEISEMLGIPDKKASDTVDELRRKGLVLMSPLWKDGQLVKMYEMLPEGADALRMMELGASQTAAPEDAASVGDMIDEIIRDIKESDMTDAGPVIDKMNLIKERLGI